MTKRSCHLEGSPARLPPYVYPRLPTFTSTRILRLFPGDKHESLRCGLQVVDLDTEEVPYIALSYAWGDATNKVAIDCDGHEAFITVSLHSALRRIREVMSPSTLWIDALAISLWVDALCIDQSPETESTRERERQVQMMGRIYSSATSVIVDLGERPKYFDDLWSIFEKIVAIPDGIRPTFKDNGVMVIPPELQYLDSGHPFWTVFGEFIGRPWFQRIWVVQEVVLARQVTMLLGNHHFSLAFLEAVIDPVLSMLFTLASSNPINFRLATLDAPLLMKVGMFITNLSVPRMARQVPLAKLVAEFPWQKATDARDLVYSLFGLASDVDVDSFPVDYSISPNEVSERFSHYLVKTGLGAYLILCAKHDRSNLASWFWDLSSTKNSENDRFGHYVANGDVVETSSYMHGYLACGATKSSIRIGLEGKQLIISSCVFDTVHSVDTIMPEDSIEQARKSKSELSILGLQLFKVIRRWYLQTHSWFLDEFAGVSETEVADMFWRTCIMDILFPRERTPEGCEGYFESYHDLMSNMEEWMSTTEQFPEGFLQKCHVYQLALKHACTGRRLCRTGRGSPALVPGETQVGDLICIFPGVPLPFVLRRKGENYILIDPCYVHGMMDGQALELDEWEVEEIVLE